MRLPGVGVGDLVGAELPGVGEGVFSQRIRERVAVEVVYEPYVRQQEAEAARLRRDEEMRLPGGLDYEGVFGLSLAERGVLMEARPGSIAQARRIEGVTPAGLVKLLAHVRRLNRLAATAAPVGGKVVVEGLDVTGVEDLETLDAKSRAGEL